MLLEVNVDSSFSKNKKHGSSNTGIELLFLFFPTVKKVRVVSVAVSG
jgi:hypothetical protein